MPENSSIENISNITIRVVEQTLDVQNNSFRYSWKCENCESFTPIDSRTCQKCQQVCDIEPTELEQIVQMGMELILRNHQSAELTTDVDDMNDVKIVTIPYKTYKAAVTSHRGTKQLRQMRNVGKKCPICLEDLKLGRIWHQTSCNHFFHPLCLRKVCCTFGPKPQCPVCRNSVTTND